MTAERETKRCIERLSSFDIQHKERGKKRKIEKDKETGAEIVIT